MQTQMIRHGGEILALALIYYVTARLSLLLAIPPGYATPIWPSAGIALAAALIFGYRIAPGIWLGSFAANLAISFDAASTTALVRSILLPLGISIGATLQAVAGVILIRRFVGFPASLQHERDIIRFLGLGGPVSCLISASVGATTLFLTDTLPAVSYSFSWLTWWAGDTIGVLVVTPLVLTWMGQPRGLWRCRRKTVAVPLGLAFAAMAGVFIGAKNEFLAAQHNLLAWTALTCGMTFVGLLGAFLLVVTGHASLFEQLLVQRAAELERTRHAEEAAWRLAAIVTSSDDAIISETPEGIIVSWNAGAERMYGYSASEILGRPISTLAPPELPDEIPGILERIRRGERVEHLETVRMCKDGRRIDVSLTVSPIRDASGMVSGASAIARDISERKQAEEQIRHLAGHDALTGLPNRALLKDRLHQAISHAHRNQRRVAILFIDLDYFKNINDSLGHHIGDAVLRMASIRLQKCLREGDSVARLGGDEFVLSLPLPGDSSDAALIAKKALDALARPFIVEGHHLHISGSIGISLYPDDGADVEALMRTADTAMYHAKETGRGNFQFFTAALNQAAQQRFDVGARLHQALAKNEFVLHYQPQVDMESGTTFSTEALLRWQPPGKAPISCGAFIANAEESGLIVPIGTWALRQACRQLKIWHDAGRPELKMAVNLSPRQLEQAGFCSMLEQILNEAAIPATALKLEITENILLQRSEFNLATLTRLSEMGIQLSVDDFGTGYSSLAYLQRFPVHALKIDQSFVHDIGKDPNDTALVTAIIAMAASLHLEVIAEGVETLQHAQFLMAHGCHAAQGFYYSQAVPADTLSALFRQVRT